MFSKEKGLLSFSQAMQYLLIFLSGYASLSWEVIWQIKTSLAIGATAFGTAITLAVVMGGMSCGGLLMGKMIENSRAPPIFRLYGALEFFIGLAGLLLNISFKLLENLDTWANNSFIYVITIIIILGLPSTCMGATFPIFASIAKKFNLSLAKIYSLNILGGAIGVLMIALMVIPAFGITISSWIIAGLNISVALIAWGYSSKAISISPEPSVDLSSRPSFKEFYIIFVSGFATLTLEVAWMRSFAAIYPNTTDIFAILLACILIALGLAAKKVSPLKQKNKLLGTQIVIAGILVILATPLIERLDILLINPTQPPTRWGWVAYMGYTNVFEADHLTMRTLAVLAYAVQILIIFFISCLIIIPPMRFLGIAFPWIMDKQHSANSIGQLYALNMFSAIIGAMGSAWILLPRIGFANTSMLAGILLLSAGILILPWRKRLVVIIISMIMLPIALQYNSGIGKIRVQGFFANMEGKPAKILGYFEGPDTTASAIQYDDGTRALLINSAMAAAESGHTQKPELHYFAWMGHLPMLLHPHPSRALVICMGSGQTANALRKENPQSLDIVDINPNVFKLSKYFYANEQVLKDERVKSIVMDGRTYLRRTKKIYDVITLDNLAP